MRERLAGDARSCLQVRVNQEVPAKNEIEASVKWIGAVIQVQPGKPNGGPDFRTSLDFAFLTIAPPQHEGAKLVRGDFPNLVSIPNARLSDGKRVGGKVGPDDLSGPSRGR